MLPLYNPPRRSKYLRLMVNALLFYVIIQCLPWCFATSRSSLEEISSSSKIRTTAIGLHVLSRNVLELGKGPHPCGSTSSVQCCKKNSHHPPSFSSPKQPSSATAHCDRFFVFRFIIAILGHLNLSVSAHTSAEDMLSLNFWWVYFSLPASFFVQYCPVGVKLPPCLKTASGRKGRRSNSHPLSTEKSNRVQ